jgi:hypothetical protein
VNLYAERPKTSTQSPLPRVSPLVVSPQRWTSLRALKLRKPRQSLRSPQAQKVHKALSVPRVLRLVQPVLLKVMMLRVPLQGRSQPSSPRRLPRALSPMDLGNPVGLNQAKAIHASVQKTTATIFACCKVPVGSFKLYPGQISHQLVCNSSHEHQS